jgi:hypothetical protein
MLSTIVTSKARLKVLKLFFNGGESYSPYVREVVRATGLEINAVRRELVKLSKEKLLLEDPRGNRLHYHLNPKHGLYYDLASILAREVGIGASIYKKRNKLGAVKFVLLSLNFFLKTGEKTPVDLVIVGDVYLSELKSIVDKYQKNEDREINYMVISEHEYRMLKDRKDPMMVNILSQPRSIIIGSQKKFLGL